MDRTLLTGRAVLLIGNSNNNKDLDHLEVSNQTNIIEHRLLGTVID